MRPGELYGARLSALGVALAAGGALLLIVMLRALFGPGSERSGSAASPARVVALWLPEAADPGADPTRRRLEAWRALLPDEPELLRDASGITGRPGSLAIVVVDGRRISGVEAARLLGFVRAGGALVLAGSLGVRDAEGGWRGYDEMCHLLDVDAVAPLPAERSRALVARRRGPLTAALVPGARAIVQPEPGRPAIPVEASELAWAEEAPRGAPRRRWAEEAPPGAPRRRWAEEAPPGAPRGASRRRRLGAGRLAWIAAGPESAPRPVLGGIARDALRWVSGQPVVELLPGEALEEPDVAGPEAWRRLRGRVSVSLVRAGERRLRLDVTNRGRRPVAGAAVRLHLSRPLGPVEVSATRLPQELPRLRPVRAGERWELLLPRLSRGSQAWHLDWRGPAGGEGDAP